MLVNHPSVRGIGRFEADASEKIALSAAVNQFRDSAPEEGHDGSVSEFGGHAGASYFDCERSDRLEPFDVEFLFRIESELGVCRDGAEMDAVGSDDFPVVLPDDDKVETAVVEFVFVDSVMKIFESFALFEVEDAVAQTENSFKFFV